MMRRCVSELAHRRRPDNVVSLVSVLRDGLLESILLMGLLCLILLSASVIILYFHMFRLCCLLCNI